MLLSTVRRMYSFESVAWTVPWHRQRQTIANGAECFHRPLFDLPLGMGLVMGNMNAPFRISHNIHFHYCPTLDLKSEFKESLPDFEFSDPRKGILRRLSKRLARHGNELFTFLDYPGIHFHNNHAEKSLRASALQRRITFGNRSPPNDGYFLARFCR
jgi:hypothetical protein